MAKSKIVLHDVLSMAIAHIEVIRKQLTDLNLTTEDPVDSDKAKRAQFLMAAASAIIDIMHPSFGIAYDIFPDPKIHQLLDYYKDLHDKHPARDGKIKCPCVMCSNEPETRLLQEEDADK